MSFNRSLKEFARQIIFSVGAYRFLNRIREKKGLNIEYLNIDNLKDRFSYIYNNDIWRNGNSDMPKSGIGSSLEATRYLRAELPIVIDDIQANSILDIGCGDLTWISVLTLRQKYTGIDIVSSVVERNRVLYPQHEFICADATIEILPPADLVICREVIFHLSFYDARQLLNNIINSGSKYLMVTSDDSTYFNSNIESGDFRSLNLRKPPFRFPAPLKIVRDDQIALGRYLGLWSLEDLAKGIGT